MYTIDKSVRQRNGGELQDIEKTRKEKGFFAISGLS